METIGVTRRRVLMLLMTWQVNIGCFLNAAELNPEQFTSVILREHGRLEARNLA